MTKEHLEDKSSKIFSKTTNPIYTVQGGGSTIANTGDKYFEQKILHTEKFFKSRIHIRFIRILHKKNKF